MLEMGVKHKGHKESAGMFPLCAFVSFVVKNCWGGKVNTKGHQGVPSCAFVSFVVKKLLGRKINTKGSRDVPSCAFVSFVVKSCWGGK